MTISTVATVIPLYNKEPYIARAIASVLAQTRPVDEIIIVDDASTDGSLERIKAFQDSRIRVIRLTASQRVTHTACVAMVWDLGGWILIASFLRGSTLTPVPYSLPRLLFAATCCSTPVCFKSVAVVGRTRTCGCVFLR